MPPKSKSLAEHNEWVMMTNSNKRSIHVPWAIECPRCSNSLNLSPRIKLIPNEDFMSKSGYCEKCDEKFEVLI